MKKMQVAPFVWKESKQKCIHGSMIFCLITNVFFNIYFNENPITLRKLFYHVPIKLKTIGTIVIVLFAKEARKNIKKQYTNRIVLSRWV